MKHQYSFDHIRQKDGEPLVEWCLRAIGWAVTDSKGREARIRAVLQKFEALAHDESKSEVAREMKERHDIEMTALRKRIGELEAFLSVSVSRIDAEEARRKAAEGMRNRAAERAENPDGSPTALSEAIRELSDPKPLWTDTVRPG